MCGCLCVYVCVRACVRAYMYACMRACVRVFDREGNMVFATTMFAVVWAAVAVIFLTG